MPYVVHKQSISLTTRLAKTSLIIKKIITNTTTSYLMEYKILNSPRVKMNSICYDIKEPYLILEYMVNFMLIFSNFMQLQGNI